jgi:2-succinyl-5-enolpyruvyl-6-hydroxy-3-cyclohexene-1-carboxylate synthase
MENSKDFETYFETVQDLELKNLCALYKIKHFEAMDAVTLKAALSDFYLPSDSPLLLEVKTPRLMNDKILLEYFDFIS